MKRLAHFLSSGFLTLCLSATLFSSVTATPPEDAGIDFKECDGYTVDMAQTDFAPTAFSVAAWVRTPVPEQTQVILNMAKPSRCFTFYFYQGRVRMLLELDRGQPRYDYVTADIPEANVWTHYCGTYDGQTLAIYRDGTLVASKLCKNSLGPDSFRETPLCIGTNDDNSDRSWTGDLDHVALWNRGLDAKEVRTLYEQNETAVPSGLLACWTADQKAETGNLTSPVGNHVAKAVNWGINTLLNQKDDGFRSIWYYNQRLQNEYVYKYSGGLGTYPANHYPFSVYCPDVNETFFCYGGTDRETESTLLHEVACFDHRTGMLSRPTIILDKKTEDAHDNPVMTVDDDGYIWIFSTSHGTSRPSWIHKSVRPYDISEFVLIHPTKIVDGNEVPMNNFSYLQIWTMPGRGMVALFTTYDRSLLHDPNSVAQRILCFMTSRDGVHWSSWQPIAAIKAGHYQNGAVSKSGKIGTSFNYHPWDREEGRLGLNWRTNLYYLETTDMGKSWQTVTGEKVEVPLTEINNPALVYDYEAERQNVYIVDMVYDENDYPLILYITSKGFESGPENDPRICRTAHWNGSEWEYSEICAVDNNYDFGSLCIG